MEPRGLKEQNYTNHLLHMVVYI